MEFNYNSNDKYSKFGKKYSNLIQNSPEFKNCNPNTPLLCGPVKNGYSLKISPPLYNKTYPDLNIIWDEIMQDFIITIKSPDPVFCVTFDVFIIQTPSPNPQPGSTFQTDFIWISLNSYRFILSNKVPSFTLKAEMITPSRIGATNHATILLKDILTGKQFSIPVDISSDLCGCAEDGCLSWPMSGPSAIALNGKNIVPFESNEGCTGIVSSWIWELWVLNTRGGVIILNGMNIGTISSSNPSKKSKLLINKQIHLPPSSLYTYQKNPDKTTPAYIYVKAKINANVVSINEVGMPVSLVYATPPVVSGGFPWKPE